jgi:hypothetical protein
VGVALYCQRRYFGHELPPAPAQLVNAAGEICPPAVSAGK